MPVYVSNGKARKPDAFIVCDKRSDINRVPVPVPHDQFVAAFRTWMDAGAPCPQAPARG